MQRRGLRLPSYDYGSAGLYFVTICLHGRRRLFGRVEGVGMELSSAGQMVLENWRGLPNRFEWVEVDDYVQVMPDHVHGIIVLQGDGPIRLPEVVGAFKSLTTARYGVGVREQGWPAFDRHLWQRGYHEHIIRNDHSLREIREYIHSNPVRWAMRQGTLPADDS